MRPVLTLFVSVFVIGSLGCKGKDKGREGPSGAKSIEGNELAATNDKPSDRPTFRLDDRAAPTGYEVRLTIDPSSEVFTGKIKIKIDVARESQELWMHGRDLEIEKATLSVGGRELVAETVTGDNHLLGFVFPEAVPAGKAELTVAYKGRIVRRDGSGIFAEEEGGSWYQYTQFESLYARRAFPCFDEPRWKTPWKLALEVNKNLEAFSNTLVEKEEALGETKLVSFLETKALPSYLVAFAVGPFETVPAGKLRSGAPVNIIAPAGRSAEAVYAAEVTGQITTQLEDYFGTPYPYRKLDTLIISTTQGFGAMEHPGLITFASNLALWTKEQDTFERRRLFAIIQSHEVGHQWFGNLVTMPWWDDIWLNEAFASWIQDRALEDWRPTWKLAASAVELKEQAMAADSLGSARRIREPVLDESGVNSAFDDITYEKGKSVIGMFETYVGEIGWRDGVRAYLKKHAWGTATAADFLRAMDESTGKDISTPFNSFLEQNGTPLVTMTLDCQKGKAPALTLAQRRYLPSGSKAASSRTWQVPICVTHSGGSACTLLTEKSGTLALGKVGAACPTWVNPNKAGLGYYRGDLGRPLREALSKVSTKKLTLAERLSAAGDLAALVKSGAATFDEGLAALPMLIADREPMVNIAGVKLATAISKMVGDAELPALRARFKDVFSPLAKRIGFVKRRGESVHIGELRPALFELSGLIADDPDAIGHARKASRVWLNGGALDPEMLEVVLAVAARHGDEALLSALAARAVATDNRIEKNQLLRALGHFRGPLTERALGVSLAEGTDPRDGIRIVRSAAEHRETQEAAVEFVLANYDKLESSLSKAQLRALPRRLSHVCEPALRKKIAASFAERSAKLSGERELKQAIEQIDLCIAIRRNQAEAAKKALTAPGK